MFKKKCNVLKQTVVCWVDVQYCSGYEEQVLHCPPWVWKLRECVYLNAFLNHSNRGKLTHVNAETAAFGDLVFRCGSVGVLMSCRQITVWENLHMSFGETSHLNCHFLAFVSVCVCVCSRRSVPTLSLIHIFNVLLCGVLIFLNSCPFWEAYVP